MPESIDRGAELYQVANRLRIDAVTAEVLRAFALADVRSLVLKGRAIATWLYGDGDPRWYVDCDLLVRPDDLRAAGGVLSGLEFERRYDDGRMPPWWREHASEWSRGSDGVMVDLHRRIPGVGIDDGAAWEVLSAETETLMIGGQPAPVLGLSGRALHIALHAAHHGPTSPRPLVDLDRAVHRLAPAVWRQAVALAERLRATEALSAGLRLIPLGEKLAAELGLPPPRSIEVLLRASSPPPVALGFELLASADSWRERLAIVRRKLVPPPDFVRRWRSDATESRLALARAYAGRPLWILRHAPDGFRFWLRTRQKARRHGA